MDKDENKTIAQENFGKRFTLLLSYSEFRGNGTAFSKVFNNGKKSGSVYNYKQGGNIRLKNLIKAGRTIKVHYSQFVNFSSARPSFHFIDPLSFEERIEFEKNKISERLNEWAKESKLTNLQIELLMPEYKNIDQTNISKIRFGENQHDLLTYERMVNAFNKTLYDLFKE